MRFLFGVTGALALVAAVFFATTSSAGHSPGHQVKYGAVEDHTKYADDGGRAMYAEMKAAFGSSPVNNWTTNWNAERPEEIIEAPFLDRALPQAVDAGVEIVLSLQSSRARDNDPVAFCAWAEKVARRYYPGIKRYVVWNEPNTRLFLTQTDDAGNRVGPKLYFAILSRCYDALKAVASDIKVIGFGLSPRASTSASTEPIDFVEAVAQEMKASGRSAPLFDQIAVHPYPNPNSASDPPERGYEHPRRFGISQLERVKEALRAFAGTAQPTRVPIMVREVNWQVDTAALAGYTGTENVNVIDEATHAEYLRRMIQRYFACDPDVIDVLIFHFIDEPQRDGKDPATGQAVGGGWQSGLVDINGRRRPAFDAMRQAIQEGCETPTGGGTTQPGEETKPTGALTAAAKLRLTKQIKSLKAKLAKLKKAKKVPPKTAKRLLAILNRYQRLANSPSLTPAQARKLERDVKKATALIDKLVKKSVKKRGRRP